MTISALVEIFQLIDLIQRWEPNRLYHSGQSGIWSNPNEECTPYYSEFKNSFVSHPGHELRKTPWIWEASSNLIYNNSLHARIWPSNGRDISFQPCSFFKSGNFSNKEIRIKKNSLALGQAPPSIRVMWVVVDWTLSLWGHPQPRLYLLYKVGFIARRLRRPTRAMPTVPSIFWISHARVSIRVWYFTIKWPCAAFWLGRKSVLFIQACK